MLSKLYFIMDIFYIAWKHTALQKTCYGNLSFLKLIYCQKVALIPIDFIKRHFIDYASKCIINFL